MFTAQKLFSLPCLCETKNVASEIHMLCNYHVKIANQLPSNTKVL